MIRGSDNKCSDMVEDYDMHEFLPQNAWSFTVEGMSKYPHRSMRCCNEAVDIMPRLLPLEIWCHFLCYILKELIQKIPGNSWNGR